MTNNGNKHEIVTAFSAALSLLVLAISGAAVDGAMSVTRLRRFDENHELNQVYSINKKTVFSPKEINDYLEVRRPFGTGLYSIMRVVNARFIR